MFQNVAYIPTVYKTGLVSYTTYCSYFSRARVRACAYLLFDIGKFTLKLLARYSIYRQLLEGGLLRYHPKFVDQVWHQTMHGSIGNRHFFHYIMKLSDLPKI